MKRHLMVIIISLTLLFTLGPITSGETITDEINDVIHIKWGEGHFVYELDQREYLDIINTSSKVKENILYLKLTVISEIIFNNTVSYYVTQGNHSFHYNEGEIFTSSSFINYTIKENILECNFTLEENETVYNQMLYSSTGESYKDHIWYDINPDIIPPYFLFGIGMGTQYRILGKGITISVMNIHPSKSVNSSLTIDFKSIFGSRTSTIGPMDLTMGPNDSDYIRIVNWYQKPFFSFYTISFSIEDVTIYLKGISINQWYYITDSQISYAHPGYTSMVELPRTIAGNYIFTCS